MRIGLIDVDSHHFPNLPLMKLSSFHKQNGDTVEWYDGVSDYHNPYDRVYMSKVFTETPDYTFPIYADEIIQGGTGYDFQTVLPSNVEAAYPDYYLYNNTTKAYGFLTRGCPRGCTFCCVSEKEGCVSRKTTNLNAFWRGQHEIKLLDPNLMACPERKELLEQLIESGAWVDFTQGLDIRLMTEELADIIMRCKVKMIHFAWDTEVASSLVCQKLRGLKKQTGIDRRKAGVYILTNYDTPFAFDLYRVYELRSMGFDPYVMVYNKFQFVNEKTRQLYPIDWLLKKFTYKQIEHFKQVWSLSRWVNNKIIFRSCERFEDYRPELG